MNEEKIIVPFTICFCTLGKKVLMIRRVKHPYVGLWNGIGGHIEEGETPLECIIREFQEETDIALPPNKFTLAGLATWNLVEDGRALRKGMYVYTVKLDDSSFLFPDKNTPAGVVSWQPINAMSDKNNPDVAKNLYLFLPHSLTADKPHHYKLLYIDNVLAGVDIQEWEYMTYARTV